MLQSLPKHLINSHPNKSTISSSSLLPHQHQSLPPHVGGTHLRTLFIYQIIDKHGCTRSQANVPREINSRRGSCRRGTWCHSRRKDTIGTSFESECNLFPFRTRCSRAIEGSCDEMFIMMEIARVCDPNKIPNSFACKFGYFEYFIFFYFSSRLSSAFIPRFILFHSFSSRSNVWLE